MQLSEEVQKILTKAKVNVANQEVIRERNEKGHFIAGSARMILTVEGHGVSSPIKRNYFKKTKLPMIAQHVKSASLQRVKKNSNQVILEIAI